MLTVTLQGDRELRLKLLMMPASVQRALNTTVHEWALKLQTHIVSDYLSGPTGAHTLSVGPNTPQHTGGQLRRSVVQDVQSSAVEVSGTVGYSADVPYAPIHEFGGTIHVPEIYPVNAKALHFVVDGKEVFARFARAHDVLIPERAPVRTGFADMQEDIKQALQEAVAKGLQVP